MSSSHHPSPQRPASAAAALHHPHPLQSHSHSHSHFHSHRYSRMSAAAVTPSGMVGPASASGISPSTSPAPPFSASASANAFEHSSPASGGSLFGVPPLFARSGSALSYERSSAAASPAGGLFQPTPAPPPASSHSHSLLPAGAVDSLFYRGVAHASNPDSLFVQVTAAENEGGVSPGSEFWANVPWSALFAAAEGGAMQHREVFSEIMEIIRQNPALRQRAVQLLSLPPPSTPNNTIKSTFLTSSSSETPFAVAAAGVGPADFSLLPTTSPWIGSTGTSSSNDDAGQALFSPATAASFWNSSSSNSSPEINRGSHAMFGQMPDTPPTPALMDFRQQPLTGLGSSGGSIKWDSGPGSSTFGAPALFGLQGISLPPMPAPRSSAAASAGVSMTELDGFYVANPSTIDPFLNEVRDVTLNSKTEEYIWHPADCTLYRLDSAQGRQALAAAEPGCTKFRFPPGTMIMTIEKDGAIASPAYSPAHPHSNEWLKAQVCHHRCPYRAGTASLKRPKTVRQHFEKCVFLDEHHPLKVLSGLQLAVLEKESQGLLPNRRKARSARLQAAGSPY